MWTVVIFLEENSVEVIPVSWLLSDGACYWPPNEKGSEKGQAINRIMSCAQPHDSWHIYSIRFPNGKQKKYNEYLRARKACKAAEVQSDIGDSDVSSRRKPKKKILSSSDEDDSDTLSNMSIPFPKIPGKNKASSEKNAQSSSVFDKDNNVGDKLGDKLRGHAAKDIETSAKPTTTTSIVNVKVVDLLLQLTHEVSKISVKLDYLQQDVNKLREEIPDNQSQVCEKGRFDEWQEMFPLKSVEDITILEELLEIKEKRSSLLEYIQLIGGSHLQEITQRSLSRLIDDDLAVQYSFAGKKGKLAFEKLKLGLVLQEAIVWNARKKIKDTTEKDVQKAVADWLRHAKERKQRRDKKENRDDRNEN